MGWNNGYTLLTAPVSLGDISVATGLGGPPYDLGDMIMNGPNINAMAKYKPVRHSNPGILSVSDRAAVRYGFAAALPQLALSNNEPQNDWSYLRPRGIGYTEYFRDLDFDGYAPGACTPLVVEAARLAYDDWSYINLFAEGISNGHRPDGRIWIPNQSLSIQELLESASDYYGSYIAFLLIDTTDWAKNLIITGKTFSSFINQDYGYKTFQLNFDDSDKQESGVWYPRVPILNSYRRNHNFRVVVCLLPGGNPSSGYAYNVISSDLYLYTPYSVAFVPGSDRITDQLVTGAFTMDGTQITAMSIEKTDMVTEVSYGGFIWRAYRITVNATLSTANVPYAGATHTISGTLTLSNTASYVFGSSPSSGNSTITPAVSATLVGGTAGQQKTLFSSDNSNYLWVPVSGGLPSTSVNASVVFDYPFNNDLTGSASSITVP